MTSTKNFAFFPHRPLSFMLCLLLVLAWGADPLLAQHQSGHGHGRGTHSGPRFGAGMGGHSRHFGGHSGGQSFGGPHSSFGLGFHTGDFTFGFGDHGFSGRFGSPYRGLGYGYPPYAGSYAYDTSGYGAYGYGFRRSYPIRPVIRDRGDRGDSGAGGNGVRPDESARLDLRAEPARLVLLLPPTRAEVYLDGRFIGIAAELRHREGFLIDAGEHRLETVHPTFESRTFDFSAGPGETVELE